jgi:hypothetical protein
MKDFNDIRNAVIKRFPAPWEAIDFTPWPFVFVLLMVLLQLRNIIILLAFSYSILCVYYFIRARWKKGLSFLAGLMPGLAYNCLFRAEIFAIPSRDTLESLLLTTFPLMIGWGALGIAKIGDHKSVFRKLLTPVEGLVTIKDVVKNVRVIWTFLILFSLSYGWLMVIPKNVSNPDGTVNLLWFSSETITILWLPWMVFLCFRNLSRRHYTVVSVTLHALVALGCVIGSKAFGFDFSGIVDFATFYWKAPLIGLIPPFFSFLLYRLLMAGSGGQEGASIGVCATLSIVFDVVVSLL